MSRREIGCLPRAIITSVPPARTCMPYHAVHAVHAAHAMYSVAWHTDRYAEMLHSGWLDANTTRSIYE